MSVAGQFPLSSKFSTALDLGVSGTYEAKFCSFLNNYTRNFYLPAGWSTYWLSGHTISWKRSSSSSQPFAKSSIVPSFLRFSFKSSCNWYCEFLHMHLSSLLMWRVHDIVCSYECKLCLTLHNNEGNYLAHTQGKRHQTNLAKRAAREAKDAPAQPQPNKRKVNPRKTG